MTCVFCDILKGLAPAEIVFESEAAISIVPLNPVTPGHLLVIPRQHAEAIHNLYPQNLAHTMYDVATQAATAYPCNIIQSNGPEATQTVFHVHFHVVPRRAGDGLRLPWSKTDQVGEPG